AVVGEAGQGLKHLMRGLRVERLSIAAMSLGAAQRSFDDTVESLKRREAIGKKLSSYHAPRHRIAGLATNISMLRSFVYDMYQKVDHGEEDSLASESAMAKERATEIAKHAALEGIQMHGGNGFTREYGMESQLRAAIAPPIYGGANVIQRDIIAKGI